MTFFPISVPLPPILTTPSAPNVAGTWTIWSYNSKTPGSEKHLISYNEIGIVTRLCIFINGTNDWKKIFEAKIVERFPYELLVIESYNSAKNLENLTILGIFSTLGLILIISLVIIYKKHIKNTKNP